jgi:hypothetical protein
MLFVGRNSQTILTKYEELMTGSGEWSVETQCPEAADEFAPFTRCPPAHELVPCLDQCFR